MKQRTFGFAELGADAEVYRPHFCLDDTLAELQAIIGDHGGSVSEIGQMGNGFGS